MITTSGLPLPGNTEGRYYFHWGGSLFKSSPTRREPSLPSVERSARRRGVPDRALSLRRRSRGTNRSRAPRFLDRTRHRLHGEARRRLSALLGFPFGFRDEPHGRHPARPLSQRSRAPAVDDPG